MSTPHIRGPRRWLWVVGAAVVVALIGVGVAVGVNLGRGGTQPAPEPTTASPAPQTPSTPATSAPPTVAGVDGCLGGDSRSPQAVLDAQKAAPQTPEGAVSFVIAFARWGAQKPVVPSAEIAELDGAATTVENFAGSFDTLGNVDVPQFNLTSVNGFYRVESFTETTAKVTLMMPLVINDAIDPTLNFMPTYDVEWTERGWVVVASSSEPDREKLRTTGSAIPGGC